MGSGRGRPPSKFQSGGARRASAASPGNPGNEHATRNAEGATFNGRRLYPWTLAIERWLLDIAPAPLSPRRHPLRVPGGTPRGTLHELDRCCADRAGCGRIGGSRRRHRREQRGLRRRQHDGLERGESRCPHQCRHHEEPLRPIAHHLGRARTIGRPGRALRVCRPGRGIDRVHADQRVYAGKRG